MIALKIVLSGSFSISLQLLANPGSIASYIATENGPRNLSFLKLYLRNVCPPVTLSSLSMILIRRSISFWAINLSSFIRFNVSLSMKSLNRVLLKL